MKNLLVITWNGKEKPFQFVHFDDTPNFEILLFDYSKTFVGNEIEYANYIISEKTENKGQVLNCLSLYLKKTELKFNYIGIIDDDIIFRVSEFNYMLHIAECHSLDVFQPSVSSDSFYSHRKFIHKSGIIIAPTDWVEIMAPFYKQDLFEACGDYYEKSISSQGIDCYLMPVMQRIHNLNNTAIIHVATIKHTRPIRTHLRTYSNGLIGLQEIELIRQKALELTKDSNHSYKFDKKFLRTVLHEGNSYFIELELFFMKLYNMFNNILQQLKFWAH